MKEAMLSAEPSETVREDVRCNLPVGFALVREARVVAVGVSFPTAGAVVQWLGEHRSTVVWPDMTDAMVVHGHEGTELIWDDRAWAPAQDAHTPRERTQTRTGGTESGEGGGGAQETRSDDELHTARAHPDWEYETTTTGRKSGESRTPEGDGWEPNDIVLLYDYPQAPEGGWNGDKPTVIGRRNWERFEYHEEEHWRRRRTPETKETAPKLTFPPENASAPAQDLQSASLGDRLRALGVRFQHGVSNSDPANDEDIELSGYAYWVTVQGIEALAVEVDRMAQTFDGALISAAVFKEDRDRMRGQVEAIRAAIDREAAHGDAVTRCNLVAERFRTVLDGAGSEAGGNGEVGA